MYMTLKYHFALFDYEEPLIYYLLDHATIMGLFVGLGHYLGTVSYTHLDVYKRQL